MSDVFSVGNRMWIGSDVDEDEFLATFEAKMADVYFGEVESLATEDMTPAEKVNAWVDEATRGKIPTLFGIKNVFFIDRTKDATSFFALLCFVVMILRGGFLYAFELRLHDPLQQKRESRPRQKSYSDSNNFFLP